MDGWSDMGVRWTDIVAGAGGWGVIDRWYSLRSAGQDQGEVSILWVSSRGPISLVMQFGRVALTRHSVRFLSVHASDASIKSLFYDFIGKWNL